MGINYRTNKIEYTGTTAVGFTGITTSSFQNYDENKFGFIIGGGISFKGITAQYIISNPSYINIGYVSGL